MDGAAKDVQKIRLSEAIQLTVVGAGYMSRNFIYYDHTGELSFNWRETEERFTVEQMKNVGALLASRGIVVTILNHKKPIE